MSKPTKAEKFIAAMQANGWREVASPSRKYRKLEKRSHTPCWVGRAGAVRVGDTVSDSHSMTHLVDWAAIDDKLDDQAAIRRAEAATEELLCG